MRAKFNEEEIEQIIRYIVNEYQMRYNRDPENYFEWKGCYMFALIMEQLIAGSIIMDNTSHVVIKIDDNVYDISGKLTEEKLKENNYVETIGCGFLHLEMVLYPNGSEKKEADEIKNYLIEKGKKYIQKMNREKQKKKIL